MCTHFRNVKQRALSIPWTFMKTRIPVNTFTRPLNLQLPIRRPNSRQKRLASSIRAFHRENGTLFPEAFISHPLQRSQRRPTSCGNDNRGKDIYSPSSRFAAPWRRSARRASFVPSSFSLSSSGELLLFSVARQLARSGPSYASSLEQQQILLQTWRIERSRGCRWPRRPVLSRFRGAVRWVETGRIVEG